MNKKALVKKGYQLWKTKALTFKKHAIISKNRSIKITLNV